MTAERLANNLAHCLGAKSLTVNALYDCLRTAVYGLPGRDAVQPADLVHALAKELGKPSPELA